MVEKFEIRYENKSWEAQVVIGLQGSGQVSTIMHHMQKEIGRSV